MNCNCYVVKYLVFIPETMTFTMSEELDRN